MLTTSAPGCQTDTPMGRLAAHLPSASEGIAACAVELEMSSNCDGGFSLHFRSRSSHRGGVCVCVCTGTHVESATVCGCSSSCTPSLLPGRVRPGPCSMTKYYSSCMCMSRLLKRRRPPTPLTPTSVGGFHRSKSGTPPSTLG